jgi:hypothetical protein
LGYLYGIESISDGLFRMAEVFWVVFVRNSDFLMEISGIGFDTEHGNLIESLNATATGSGNLQGGAEAADE